MKYHQSHKHRDTCSSLIKQKRTLIIFALLTIRKVMPVCSRLAICCKAVAHGSSCARRLDAAAEEERREKEEEAKRIDQKDVELRPDFLDRVNKKVSYRTCSVL